MRFLAIDLGDKRTGLATGDDSIDLVSPLTVLIIPRGDALLSAIVKVIDEYGPNVVVIGLPVNMDGTEGQAANKTRAFGNQLADRCDIEVVYQDERLTTFAADLRMAQSGKTHKAKKKLRDSLAAATILRDYLDGRN